MNLKKIDISLVSGKYYCSYSIKEKVTFIQGDSGVGKSEFVRRFLNMENPSDIKVTGGFSLFYFTKNTFINLCRRVVKKTDNFTDEDIKTLKKAWLNYFPFDDVVFLIDDEDFVDTDAFSTFINCDKYNYYIIINRTPIPSLSYSANEVYRFIADGRNHYLEPYYKRAKERFVRQPDLVLVEGVGSDYTFFSKLFKDTVVRNPSDYAPELDGGRHNVVKCLIDYGYMFKNKVVFVAIDFCAFGSNIVDFVDAINKHNLDVIIDSSYLSFEYLLLKSNFINDDIDQFIIDNILKFSSIEKLCTDRLHDLTKDSPYSYSKSSKSFRSCYYLDCVECKNTKNHSKCEKYASYKKDKLINILSGTQFEDLLIRAGILKES